jgi:hypothetical protein
MVALKKEFDKQNGKDFFDVVVLAESMGILNKKFSQLILLDYFSEFGQSKTLMKFLVDAVLVAFCNSLTSIFPNSC